MRRPGYASNRRPNSTPGVLFGVQLQNDTGATLTSLDLAFRVEQGVIRDPAAKGDAAACVARALGGKALAAPDKLSVLAQIRFPTEAPAPTSTP